MKSGEYKLFCIKCNAICEGYGTTGEDVSWATECIICEIYGNERSFMEGFRIL